MALIPTHATSSAVGVHVVVPKILTSCDAMDTPLPKMKLENPLKKKKSKHEGYPELCGKSQTEMPQKILSGCSVGE